MHRPDGSYQALDEVQPIDIFAAKGLAQPALPAGLGAAGGQRRPHRRRRPEPVHDQWFGFTPPRVPVLQTAQQFLGRQTPVLMDIATAANFPCQRPFSEHLGVAELPEYRILPNFKQVVVSSNQWQSAEDGGPFLFIQALLRTSSDPDVSARRLVPRLGLDRALRPRGAAATARRTPSSIRASTRVFGWSRSGPIRALP